MKKTAHSFILRHENPPIHGNTCLTMEKLAIFFILRHENQICISIPKNAAKDLSKSVKSLSNSVLRVTSVLLSCGHEQDLYISRLPCFAQRSNVPQSGRFLHGLQLSGCSSAQHRIASISRRLHDNPFPRSAPDSIVEGSDVPCTPCVFQILQLQVF